MRCWTLDDLRSALKRALRGHAPPIGVGERAFPRLGPALFLDGYRILCSAATADLADMRKLAPVVCLQESFSAKSSPCEDTLAILSHPLLEKRAMEMPAGTRLLIYRETPEIRAAAQARGWELLANSSHIRARWENKAWFRRRLREADLPTPTCETLSLDQLTTATYRTLARKLGQHLVVQIPDFPRGGGRSTFFLESDEEMASLGVRLADGLHRGHAFRELLVSPFIPGPSLSTEGCVTPWGTLVSPIQTQLLDCPEVLPPGRAGRFCGHQWGLPRYPSEVESSAREMTKRVGEALRKEGYRGIFGLDMALNERTGTLYGLECNPRYTGAFPTLTLLQTAMGVPPMEAFHLLAFLRSDIRVDLEAINQAAANVLPMSQILLFHRGQQEGEVRGCLSPGRYRLSASQEVASRIGPTYPLPPPPWEPSEFIVADGPPPDHTRLLPGESLERVVRLIFFRPVVQDNQRLDPTVRWVIRWVYGSLGLPAQSEERQ